MFTYLLEGNKEKGEMAKQKILQMNDLKATGQILLKSKTAARLSTSLSPGTKNGNKTKPQP